MGERIRSKDWSSTILGSPDRWPQSLRTTVSIILNSQFPMFVWWGEDLVTIYNDAYSPIAGEKHPDLLGRSGKEGWIEIWNDLSPLVKSVFAGKATWSEDQPLYMNRYGYVEETYFTFSYSPVRDESGKVAGLFCACIETTQQVLAGRKIKESERNLRATILQSPVAMSILRGPEFRVEIANERMYELWGKGPEVVLGRPIFDGLSEARNQGLEPLLQSVLTTGETFTASERPVLLPRPSGIETIYLNFVYEPFREGDGSISGIIVVGTDVTDQVMARKRIEQSEQELQQRVLERTLELERKNQELRRSNVNLEEFAYAASHDLKEPIRKIHFYSDRLKGELAMQLSDGQRHIFERLENASQRMGTLIEDLLAYSQATRGVPDTEVVNLNRKLQLVLEDLEVEVQQKGAEIIVGELPVVRANSRQMQQLFQNLITNALKYGKPGVQPRIEIRSQLVQVEDVRPGFVQEAEGAYYQITVEDNGIGFSQDDALRIFNMFTRLHGNTEYRGTGVGLSIAQKVVENHKGFIWAQGRPGEGATFYVLLPATGGEQQ